MITILGFAGSLRKGSYSKAILREAAKHIPEEAELKIFDLDGIPLFNQDIENPMPKRVREFKDEIEKADAILIVTPEHNHSVPAVLKNALEWGSRPDGDNSFDDKPAAIITISTGPRGGLRAEINLRQIFVDLNMHALNKPRLYIDNADEKFDKNVDLIDKSIRKQIKYLLSELAEWTARLKKND